MASFVELLKEFESEILGERVSMVRHDAREGFAVWLDQKAAEQNAHLTGGESAAKVGFLTPEEDAAIKADNTPAHPQVA